MEKWYISSKKADFNLWSKELGIDPVTARILRNRDIETLEQARDFLFGQLEDMHSPWLMRDMKKAAEYVIKTIIDGKSIRVIGDYDVDGVTSAYILTKGCRCLGADVTTAIPHRIHDGYGLSDDLVLDAVNDKIGLIITCDNGISAKSQIELAVEKGVDVIVTDHHEVPFELDENGEKSQILPPAVAVVNPKRYDCEYPFKGICGAMVAYKLMQGILELAGDTKALGSEAKIALENAMEELMCFATLGTVCDVMELKDENRILVKEGLKKLATTDNVGLQALMEVSKLDKSKLSTHQLGFVIGPCINASGRLDTALRALELLNEDNKAKALTIATELRELNESRKNLTNEGIEKAVKYVEENGLLEKKVWLIYLPEVHESIAGIIAGRIRERYNHPVFVFTKSEDMIKGSGRSIEGYHMQENLILAGHLLAKFGGHAMAAGLSLEEDNLKALDEFLNDKALLTEEDFVAKVHIDVPMPLEYSQMNLAREIEKLAPFGTGNPQPLFAQKDLTLIRMNRFGSEKQYARYTVRTESGRSYEITSFMNPDELLGQMDEKYGAGFGAAFEGGSREAKVSIAYKLDINCFRGEEKLQYLMSGILLQ